MPRNKIINALSYLSIFFAPFIFPLIVWIVCVDEPDVRHHAKSAMFLHLFPLILSFIAVILVATTGILTEHAQFTVWLAVLTLAVVLLLDCILFIYNLYKGIKILVN
ncbi:DUF4870 domain-containing protein [Liquorilactobacillus oeni]|uniref:Integral membrane protein n=1 Tax=Liquorilactobacillus oeni DSM 19972 TaxID=1423777 RepID=A0A0R1ME75_9LACO|nr:DUF4870 domain-containing protein [Liquorilactobacillus oeni]KRL04180.1 hypothetical protein FD46_GL001299 [Liquorilactobacillus oeni DSM 19972]